jgi:5-methylthioribose kinase
MTHELCGKLAFIMNLDIENPNELLAYLGQTERITKGEQPKITVLQGGVSNKTVLLERETESWVIKQALAKLRVKVDWYSDPSRSVREAQGLRTLSQLVPDNVPTFIFEDAEQHVLVMSAVAQPNENWKTVLLAGGVLQHQVKQFGELLGFIHRSAYERRDELAEVFADTSFFESLRLEPYYQYTASQVPSAAPFLEGLVEETRQHQRTLVHGDYSPKNTLIAQDKMILLDYEVIHWGDPAFDVGFGMTHLLSKAHRLSDQRSTLLNAAWVFWKSYARVVKDLEWRRGLEERAIRHTLACMLARVRGRSPLEYLDDAQRQLQEKIVVELMMQPPTTFNDLTSAFGEGLTANS